MLEAKSLQVYPNVPIWSLVRVLVQFTVVMQIEKVHPLQSGLFRLKRRSERRPGLPAESALAFYSKYLRDTLAHNVELARTIWWIVGAKRRIDRDPDGFAYVDRALTPVSDEEEETFDFLTKTAGAKEAIAHLKKVAALTH